jgi:hypothetical protein
MPQAELRCVMSGNIEECKKLFGWAKLKLSILQNSMQYQGLFQLEKNFIDVNQRKVTVKHIGNQPIIHIYVPEDYVSEEVEEEFYPAACWCTCCFASAIVIERSSTYINIADSDQGLEERTRLINKYSPNGDYGNWGLIDPLPEGGDAAINQAFDGIRYLVEICQGSQWAQYIATSSDFSEYWPGDKVVVQFRGRWKDDVLVVNEGCQTCQQCAGACRGGTHRPGSDTDTGPDGTYIIIPLQVVEWNDDFSHGMVTA